MAPVVEPKKGGAVNGIGGLQTVAVLTDELAAIWKRMCSPRGVVKEFDALKASVEALAGSTGFAEYHRILRQHGVDRPRQFQSAHSRLDGGTHRGRKPGAGGLAAAQTDPDKNDQVDYVFL